MISGCATTEALSDRTRMIRSETKSKSSQFGRICTYSNYPTTSFYNTICGVCPANHDFRDKENQGFRANQVNRKMFESPLITQKGRFGVMTKNSFANNFGRNQEYESKLTKLRNQHDDFTQSNNLHIQIPKLEQRFGDSKIPRTTRSQDPSTNFGGRSQLSTNTQDSRVGPNHFSKGFRDSSGNVSQL